MKCKAWLREHDLERFALYYPAEAATLRNVQVEETANSLAAATLEDGAEEHEDEAERTKHQTRGGKAMIRDDAAKKLEKDEAKKKVVASECP